MNTGDTKERLNLTNEQAVALEETTRTLSQNVLWFQQRKRRVTASQVYDVYQWKRGMEKWYGKACRKIRSE